MDRGLTFRRPIFREYRFTVDEVESGELVLIKPLTYMNASGRVFPAVQRRFKPDRIVVICDNLDLPPGAVRMKRGGAGGGHRGLASIASYLEPDEYMRLYVGIGRPEDMGAGETWKVRRSRIVDYVLGVPDAAQRQKLDEGTYRAAELIGMVPGIPVNELIERVNGSN